MRWRVSQKTSLSVEEARLAAVHASRAILESEKIHLLEATARILAGPVTAPANLPRFDHSAMDGYAVRTTDFVGPGPWSLKVIASVAAGSDIGSMQSLPGETIAISTGAAIPAGFDAVLVNERCTRIRDTILTSHRCRSGENIRRAGEDVQAGSLAAEGGVLITPHLSAMLAALGDETVNVVRRVRVAVVTTGAELKQPGEQLSPGQIYDSNRYLVQSMLNVPWIEISDVTNVTDRLEDIGNALLGVSLDHDVVITTGGMSYGAADFIRKALDRQGAHLSVLNVAMRPGKPATIGRLGGALFIGLPGNPMAAAIALRQIAFPAIQATGGLRPLEPLWFPASSGFTYHKKPGRTEFVPVSVSGRDTDGSPVLKMLGRGSSGSLSPLALADGIAVLPPDLREISEGMRLRYEPFGTSY